MKKGTPLQHDNICEVVAEKSPVTGEISHYIYLNGQKLPHVIGTIVHDHVDDVQWAEISLFVKIRASENDGSTISKDPGQS